VTHIFKNYEQYLKLREKESFLKANRLVYLGENDEQKNHNTRTSKKKNPIF